MTVCLTMRSQQHWFCSIYYRIICDELETMWREPVMVYFTALLRHKSSCFHSTCLEWQKQSMNISRVSLSSGSRALNPGSPKYEHITTRLQWLVPYSRKSTCQQTNRAFQLQKWRSHYFKLFNKLNGFLLFSSSVWKIAFCLLVWALIFFF
jgi:hypothetical protein